MYLAGTRLNHSAKATFVLYFNPFIGINFSSSRPLSLSLLSQPGFTDALPQPRPRRKRWPPPPPLPVAVPPTGATSATWAWPPPSPPPSSSAPTAAAAPSSTWTSPPDPNPDFDDLLLDNLSLALARPDPDLTRPAPDSTSLPTLTITPDVLAAGGAALICAVCKDEFAVGVDAKQLPCGHIYHPDCILPWLSHHDSCPVCRSRLPPSSPPAADGGSEEEPEPDPYVALLRTLQRVCEQRSGARAASDSPTGGLAD